MVAQVRRFNRTVTQRIGVLNENFQASDRSLGQNRLLWEMGSMAATCRPCVPGWTSTPDTSAGYCGRSRSAASSSSSRARPDAGRIRIAGLTTAGHRELAALDQRSDDAAAGEILQPLNDRQRAELVTAMAEVERLLIASTVEVRECDPRQSDARFCLPTSRRFAVRFQGRLRCTGSARSPTPK